MTSSTTRDKQPGTQAAAACELAHEAGATPGLLAAALSGLLCLSACGSDGASDVTKQPDASGDEQGGDASLGGQDGAAGGEDAGDRSDASSGEGTDASSGDGDSEEGDAAVEDTTPRITSSRVDASVTEESFREECQALNGTFELHVGCGGKNSCRGMSYDKDSHVYTEHTCKALNTCNGFSCVLPEKA